MLGVCSSFRVELWAVRLGLQLDWECGYRKILLEVDSHTVAQVIQKTDSPPKHDTLLVDIREFRSRQWVVHVSYQLRESNRAAARLSNLAVSGALGVQFYCNPPMGICHLLKQDSLGVSLCPRLLPPPPQKKGDRASNSVYLMFQVISSLLLMGNPTIVSVAYLLI